MQTTTILGEPMSTYAAAVVPTSNSIDFAKRLRRSVAMMTFHAKASHIGPCYSIADIVAVLYGGLLRVDPTRADWAQRDRFILSKGHACAVVYAALAEVGFFPKQWLEQYCDDGNPLAGHVVQYGVPGVELSTGALGHGLSVSSGIAWALRSDSPDSRVYCLLGDGETNEGSVWEAALFAGHHRLNRLCAIVDANGQQGLGETKTILDMAPLVDKWRAFRWDVREVDGHDHTALTKALSSAGENGRPTVVVAHTIKGKGVSFMEGSLAWHYRSLDQVHLELALDELNR